MRNVHKAAELGTINSLPTAILGDVAHFISRDPVGLTPLHTAARYGNLGQVPPQVLTEDNLLIKSSNDTTPVHLAALNAHLDQIPVALLTEKVLMCRDYFGRLPLHYASENGNFVFLPAELVKKGLLVGDNEGLTPLHYAAWYGHLDLMPIGTLTSELLCTRSDNGDTPLNMAACRGHLDQILGIELNDTEELRQLVGSDWWDKNKAVLKQKENLECSGPDTDVDLF